MSKIEPIDDDQDYHDPDIVTPEAANYKDNDGDGDCDGRGDNGGDDDVGDSVTSNIPMQQHSNIDDMTKEAIDSKPNLGSINNNSSANIDDTNETANPNDSAGKQQCRNGNDTNLCNAADANETNLNDSETNERSDINNKLGRWNEFYNRDVYTVQC